MSDAPYGIVTNPERFQLLHDVADRVLDELTQTYDVARSDGADLDIELAAYFDAARQVRLVPASQPARSLTVSYSAFPGLHTRFGQWHHEAFPRCGCDACDEDPVDVASQFERAVRALVGGHFDEQSDGSHYFRYADGFEASGQFAEIEFPGEGQHGAPQAWSRRQ